MNLILKRLMACLAAIILTVAPIAAIANDDYCPRNTVTPQQIADALQNSPDLQSGLKSCSMVAMAMQESEGGDTCANNPCCVGILQLNFGQSQQITLPDGTVVTASQYANMPLQQQINIWSLTSNQNTSSTGYQTLLAAYNSGQQINGVTVTPGMLGACEQFGGGVCNHNVAALQSAGDCGTYTDGNSHVGGQTICSWGKSADQLAAKENCSMTNTTANCPIGAGGFEGLTGKATASNAPNPSATDVTVATNQV